MAGLTREQRAAKAAALEADTAHLVAMTKNGETLHVHPSCVQSHKDAGWKVVE